VASASKDTRLIDSLLELAETRAIARALRFAGYGVEYTGIEEMGETPLPITGSRSHQIKDVSVGNEHSTPLSLPQRTAIENIAHSKHWDPIEACRRITGREDVHSLDDLSEDDAIEVIKRFKAKMAS
jgi:hypothetical protein